MTAATTFALLACLAVPAQAERLQAPVFERFLELDRLVSLEKANPAKAVKGYRGLLEADRDFFGPPPQYAASLQKEIESGGRIRTPEGFPHLFEARLRGMIGAYLGLARAYAALGDYTRAERGVRAALAIANQRFVWPTEAATQQLEACGVLREMYAGRGRRLKALVIDVQRELLRDYLRSPAARSEYLAAERAVQEGEAAVAEVNEHVAKASEARWDRALSVLQGTLGAANTALTGAALAQERSRPGGGSAASLRTLQMSAFVTTSLLVMDPRAARSAVALKNMLNPMANTLIVRALSDPKAGVQPVEAVRAAVGQVAKLAGAGSAGGVQAAAQGVDALLGAVEKARSGGGEAAVSAAVELAEGFQKLESAVDQAEPGDRK